MRAGQYGLDVATYQAIRAELTAARDGWRKSCSQKNRSRTRSTRCRSSATRLWRFIGESDTDSLQSWFEILRHLLDLRRPEDGIRIRETPRSRPRRRSTLSCRFWRNNRTWIFCALGGQCAWLALDLSRPRRWFRSTRRRATWRSCGVWPGSRRRRGGSGSPGCPSTRPAWRRTRHSRWGRSLHLAQSRPRGDQRVASRSAGVGRRHLRGIW